MSLPELASTEASHPPPENLVEVGVYPTFTIGSDHGLVILAMGLSYWLVPVADGFALRVEPGRDGAIREQLIRFDCESVNWPPLPLDSGPRRRPTDLLTPLLWAGVVMAVFRAELAQPHLAELGALDAKALLNHGEWWRPATALFLHADASHLVSNLLSGMVIFSIVTSTLGRRRGWLLLTTAAVAANVISALVQYPADYSSVGASTMIFSGLGLLTGRAILIAAVADRWARWRAMFVPLASGLTVLALFGAGDRRVDLGAHLCGFLTGLALGSVAQLVPRSVHARS